MKLYIDKENVVSFVSLRKDQNFEGCKNLVKENMNVHYNFSRDEIKGNELLEYWFRIINEGGVGGDHIFCPPAIITPERPLKTNFHSQMSIQDSSSIYLLNEDDKCELISAKSCVLIGKVGEEITTISKLIIENSETISKEIQWENYCPKLPLTDIIISDNHYFKNKTAYDFNDHNLLRTLVSIPYQSPVNVIIISKEGEIDSTLDLTEEQKNIKRIVLDSTKNSKSTVTILTTYKTHDRSLITNYYRIKNGSSFLLKNNSLKSDVTAEVKSHAIKNNLKLSNELITVYQSIASSPVRCIGDRKSNFLNFP